MAQTWTVELRARRSPEQRCALCHDGIGTSARACLRCLTLYHDDCVKELGRCPTLGCAEKARTVSPVRAEAEERALTVLSSLGLWLRLLALTTIYTTIALVTLVSGLVLVFAVGGWPIVPGLFFLGLSFLAVRAINRERVYHNGRRSGARA